MKRLNFIDTLSAPRHRSTRLWFTHTLIALCAIFICICILQGIEVYEYFITHNTIKRAQLNIAPLIANNQETEALKHKKQALAQLHTHIDSCTHSPCNPHDTLCMLTTLCALPLSIHSAHFNKEGIDVAAKTTSAREVATILTQLKQEKVFANMELVSIAPDQKGVLFRVKNKI